MNAGIGAAKPVDIYARVSRLKRDEKRELSTAGQVAVCRARLADLSLTEGEALVDPGRSAWNPNVQREAWDQLMDRLERGVSGGVIVFDLERFSRQPKDGERMIELAANGLLVLDSESEYDLRTPNGKKAFRDAMNAAAYYSDRLSTRVARGKRLKALGGQPNGSSRPFGFEPDLVTVRASEAAVIRDLTRRFLAGESQDGLVDDLNARGVRTSYGNLWTRAQLRQVLTRERNCGRIIYTDAATGVASVVGRLPDEPIVTEDDFERVCARFTARRRGRPISPAYLCSGIAICGIPGCGKPLTGRPRNNMKPYEDGSVRRQYWCGPSSRGGCVRISVDQRGLDEAAAALAIEILSDPRNTAAIDAAARELASQTARLDLEIAEAEDVAEALADRLGRGEITLARYDRATNPLDARIQKLKAERAALSSPSSAPATRLPVKASREQWQRRWEDANAEEKRALLKMALRGRHLVVGPATGTRAERTDVTRRITIV
jgi:DNA invertase Pin-like site-specific DNA recombinase